MGEVVTICFRCRWHRGHGDVWYNQFCGHPDLQNPKMVDPVTGRMGYVTKNAFGNTLYESESAPYCRDINDGMCSRWESTRAATLAPWS